jgi:uncharacterized HhH-GPD family protein
VIAATSEYDQRLADRLYFTDSDEANALIASDPMALLVGFELDQQVTVQKAFTGPIVLRERLGTLDAATLASTDLEPVFRAKPAIHRFPGSMATRIQDLATVVADEYDGRAERIWLEAADGTDLKRRLAALPGFGDMKVRTLSAILAKQFGIAAAAEIAPDHRTLGDVDSPDSLAEYQAAKRARKAAARAAKA